MGSGDSNQSGGGSGGGGGVTTGSGLVPETVPRAEIMDQATLDSMSKEQGITVNPGGQLVGPGVKAEQLSDADKAPIKAYTSSSTHSQYGLTYADLNQSLREGNLTQNVKAYTKKLNSSLDKIRNYKGEVYRVIGDKTGSVAKNFTPGKPVKLNEFLSTSRSASGGFGFMQATSDTKFKIQSKSGKLVEQISATSVLEREVLFKSGTRFMVTGKSQNAIGGGWTINLREI